MIRLNVILNHSQDMCVISVMHQDLYPDFANVSSVAGGVVTHAGMMNTICAGHVEAL